MVLAVVVQLWLAQAGCTKDTDCKGDRICEAGACVAPKREEVFSEPPPPPRAPLEAPASDGDWPRVVHRDGLICVQAPGANGQIEESCRTENTATPRLPLAGGMSAPSTPAEPVVMPTRRGRRGLQPEVAPEPAGRFVADVVLQGGVGVLAASGASVALPQFTGHLSLGGRFRSGIGVVGFGNILVMGVNGFTWVTGTVGPALRFGDRTHFTLGAGGSIGAFSGGGTSGTGVMGSILLQVVFAVAGAFGISLQSALHVDTSGILFTLGAGIAFGAF